MCNAHNHPPGCTCGWGGFGSSGGGSSMHYLRTAFNDWMPLEFNKEHSDFCAEVNCRDCGQLTYLIHHNGGYVLVDELGWPWPIHPCYQKKRHEYSYFLEENDILNDMAKFKRKAESSPKNKLIAPLLISDVNVWGKGKYLLLSDLKGINKHEIYVESRNNFYEGRILGVSLKFQVIYSPFRKPIKFYSVHSNDDSLPNYEDVDQSVTPKLHKIADYSSPTTLHFSRRSGVIYDERIYCEIQLKENSKKLEKQTSEKVFVLEEFVRDLIEIDDDKCCYKSSIDRDIAESHRKELQNDFDRLHFQKKMDIISADEFNRKRESLLLNSEIKVSNDGKKIHFKGI